MTHPSIEAVVDGYIHNGTTRRVKATFTFDPDVCPFEVRISITSDHGTAGWVIDRLVMKAALITPDHLWGDGDVRVSTTYQGTWVVWSLTPGDLQLSVPRAPLVRFMAAVDVLLPPSAATVDVDDLLTQLGLA